MNDGVSITRSRAWLVQIWLKHAVLYMVRPMLQVRILRLADQPGLASGPYLGRNVCSPLDLQLAKVSQQCNTMQYNAMQCHCPLT